MDTTFATKDFLSMATDNVPNAGRYLLADGYQVNFPDSYTETYVRSIFENAGITVTSVSSFKSPEEAVTPKAGGNNCSSAQLLCSNTSQTANSSGFGVQELNAVNRGCLTGNEHQSSWYYLNVQTGGSLTMTINPSNTADDYDFAIWGPFTSITAAANCPPITPPIRCSFSSTSGTTGLATMNLGTPSGCGFLGLFACPPSAVLDLTEGAGGDRFVQPLTTLANQVYILLVDNFSNSGNPYNMNFGGSSVLGCTPVPLPVVLTSFTAQRSNTGTLISWTTGTEERSDLFTIEWCTDPSADDWKQIAEIPAAGQSTSEQQYATIHQTPSATKTNYYRLSLMDLDGQKSVFSARIVAVEPSNAIGDVVYIYNLLGQEVDQNYHGIVIYQFEDGSTKKVNQ